MDVADMRGDTHCAIGRGRLFVEAIGSGTASLAERGIAR